MTVSRHAAVNVLIAISVVLGACDASKDPTVEPTPGSVQRPPVSYYDHDWPKPRSIILVMIDTLRADVLAAYGGDQRLTPNLDVFSEDAVVFTQAYATSSWTRSSVATMLSGRYAGSHAVLDKEDIVSDDVVLLPEILESRAATWSFGITTNGNTSGKIGFGQGYDEYGPIRGVQRRRYPGDRIGLVPGPVVTTHALDMLDDPRAQTAELNFAFIQYIDPHDPYFPNPGLMTTPEPQSEFSGSRVDIDALVAAGEDALTEPNMRRLRWLYDSEVRFVDDAFGQLIDGLKARGLYDEAMIIVVSDHGEAFWEHGVRGHGKTLYEEEIRVPFLIRMPGMGKGDGQVLSQPVSLVDIAPTIINTLGWQPLPFHEGLSLLPLLEGQLRQYEEPMFAELALFEKRTLSMVRKQDLKLVVSFTRKDSGERQNVELYDLATDPGETKNLANDPAWQDRRVGLLSELSAREAAIAGWAVQNQSVDLESLDPELLEELKGLGYIQD